jgi:hypothetical protein
MLSRCEPLRRIRARAQPGDEKRIVMPGALSVRLIGMVAV